MNVMQSHSKKPTSVEVRGYSILQALGVVFEAQKLLFGKFCVDAFIPSHNLVVQFDGAYWHGHPSTLRNGIPDPRQQSRMNYDRSQDAYLRACGCSVLRLWDFELKDAKSASLAVLNALRSKPTLAPIVAFEEPHVEEASA